jgi:ribosomal protein S12 methylthiotransferase accessory factor YcaO
MSLASFRPFHTPYTFTRGRTAYPVLTAEPAAFSIYDPQKLAGYGFGFDYTTHLKARGEYLERFIAFRGIRYTHTSTINAMNLSPEARVALLSVLAETCSDRDLLESVAAYPFRTIHVRNLITQEEAELPWVFFSLHSSGDCQDFSYVPLRDTSGSAFHPHENEALESAVMEFIERQNLTAMWASRRCLGHEILHPDSLDNGSIRALAQLLCRKGLLHIYDISFIAGVETIFITYKAKDHDDYVQFSCGSSTALTRQLALKKALIETWQTGLLLLQMSVLKEKEYGGDQLKEQFKKANSASFDLGLEVIPEDHPIGPASYEHALQSLTQVSPHIFFYTQPYDSGRETGFYCKIFSPDFFVHMNPGKGNNNSNKWLKKIAHGRTLRLEVMPFV